MSPLTATPATPVTPAASGGGAAQALFQEARRRRRRRWLTGMALIVVLSAVGAVAAVTWPHRPAGHDGGGTGPAGTSPGARSSVAAVWFDGVRLRVGYIHPGGRVTQRAGAEVNADLMPLVQAAGRVYWVDPAGAFVPALGHWSQVVRYLDLATGKTGIAGAGQTVFLSAGGRYLLMSQDATSLTETPVAGTGAPRQLTLPRGWYLPGGDGLPDVGSGEGLATANGIIVQSAESSAWRPRTLGVWDPRSGTVAVIGRELAVIGAYTPPGARFSLLAWLPAACPFPDNCLIRITNTATLSTRTVRSPLPGGFAVGGAFSPDGTQLAVFPQTAPRHAAPGSARLAIVSLATGAVRVAQVPRLALGTDFAWARWLPGGTHLIVGAGAGPYLVDSVTLVARPLSVRGRGHDIGSSQDINFTAAIVPLRR